MALARGNHFWFIDEGVLLPVDQVDGKFEQYGIIVEVVLVEKTLLRNYTNNMSAGMDCMAHFATEIIWQ
jgi:hypothetical protein